MTTLPQHATQIDDDRLSKAPYNFVRLPEGVAKASETSNAKAAIDARAIPDRSKANPDTLSGEIHCTLTTASPIYIRAGLTPEQKQSGLESKDMSAFFYVGDDGNPVIPGSSLRGMFRSLVEIISFSKFTTDQTKQLMYRAVGDQTSVGKRYREALMDEIERNTFVPKIRGGYIKALGNDKWAINPAKEIGGATWARIKIDSQINRFSNRTDLYVKTDRASEKNVRHVSIEYSDVQRWSPNPQQGYHPVVLCKSGRMHGKKTEAVVFEKIASKKLRIPDALVNIYREDLSNGPEKIVGPKGVLQDGHPIFFVLDNNAQVQLFWGHTRNFRIPYPLAPSDYIPKSVKESEALDLADAIFGFTKDKGKQYSGRVSFGQATLAPNQTDIYLNNGRDITPKVLSTPKPTCYQHYLTQPAPNAQVIGKTRDGRAKTQIALADYGTSPRKAVLRGTKLFWHKGNVTTKDIQVERYDKSKENVYTKIRPITANKTFSFKIRFTQLKPHELGAIVWLLNIASDENYRLKIGMGKPLGLGAIAIESDVKLTTVKDRYSSVFNQNDWASGAVAKFDSSAYMTAFEKWVLESNGHLSLLHKRLSDHPRIKDLLTMLSWPGPSKTDTRYLEIERLDPNARRGKTNEYKLRPVLGEPQAYLSPTISVVRPKLQERPKNENILTGLVVEKELGATGSFWLVRESAKDENVLIHVNNFISDPSELSVGQKVEFELLNSNGEYLEGINLKVI